MSTKKDYFLVSIIGFFFGLLLLPVLKNLNVSFLKVTPGNSLLIVVGFIIFAIFALWVASLLGRRIPVLLQFAKFGAVGALTTFLDLGVLNAMIFFSGIAAGSGYSIFKAISFTIAVINSYFWNKYWTFGVSSNTNIKEFGQFLIVSVVGFGINVGIASLVVNIIGPLGNISPAIWANIGALAATALSLIWNFIGYKLIVFKEKPKNQIPV